ncbi:7018_t:CDS:2 [Funneliformis caledonium]|uniref:7018_t:CDS:1 n=1 Tax=Funneliformis caledonium TaxID=1117310 RepID=A0A9N9CDQ3_9GLOM|nr:7018_t:CDS:2 [Funneliformis caledonium]
MHNYKWEEERGEIFDQPTKDIILKDIIKSKIERIKDLEISVEELENEIQVEREKVKNILTVDEK